MPYRAGYSVLPNLTKIDVSDVFRPTPDLERMMARKRAIRAVRQTAFRHEADPEVLDAVAAFVASHHPTHPDIPEDTAIHVWAGERDWLAACDVSFPSGWRPEEKIGRPLEVIHAPIPGMNLGASHQLAKQITQKGPFERFVWSVVYDPARFDYHPDSPPKEFDPARVCVKVERQVTVPFPAHRAALFVLRQEIVTDIDRKALADAVAGMTAEQLRYKGLAECRDELIAALTASGG